MGAKPTQPVLTTVWPSGLRRWLQAPVRKGVGSNPTAVTGVSGCVWREASKTNNTQKKKQKTSTISKQHNKTRSLTAARELAGLFVFSVVLFCY